MFALVLNIKVIDKDDKVVDETQWPLVQTLRDQWCRGVNETKGHLFATLGEVTAAQEKMLRYLRHETRWSNPAVAKLMDSIRNTRGTVQQSAPENRLTVELMVLYHKPLVLDTTPVDL